MSDLVYQNYNNKCKGWVNPSNLFFGPQITTLTSYQSPAGSNTVVSIVGANFFSYSVVRFGTFTPTVYFINSTLLSFYVPNTLTSGTFPVQVCNGSVCSNIVNYTIDNASGFWISNGSGTISNSNASPTVPSLGGGLLVRGNISQTLNAAGCVSIGANSLPVAVDPAAIDNTCVGQDSGSQITTGSNNTCIGQGSNVSTGNISYSTAIGSGAQAINSNQIVLGRASEYVSIPSTLTQSGGGGYALTVGGDVNISGICKATSFNPPSDYRIKNVIDHITIDKDEYTIDNLKPIKYVNGKNGHTEIGFLAHEVQESFPYLVTGEKDGKDLQTLNYMGLIGVLVKEIQGLKHEINLLKTSK
jgi:hypothetical protein